MTILTVNTKTFSSESLGEKNSTPGLSDDLEFSDDLELIVMI